MTEKLYYEDGYLRECDAVVVSFCGGCAELDRTIFYPEGGGQPGDIGYIGECKVSATTKDDDGRILHHIEQGTLVPGQSYRIRIDWPHRYRFMQAHTAQHMISATLFNQKGIGTVAVHQGDLFITVETDRSDIEDDVLLDVEKAVNKAICSNLRVWHETVSHKSAEELGMRRTIKVEGDVMLVHIDTVDVIACGGVHIANTGEARIVLYEGKEAIRGHVRTIWRYADSAYDAIHANASLSRALSVMLSAESDDIGNQCMKVIDERNELRRQIRALEEKAAYSELCSNSDSLAFSSDLPLDSFIPYLEKIKDGTLIADGSRFIYIGDKDAFDRMRERLSSFSVKGGGRNRMFRGSYKGDMEAFSNAVRRFEG